MEIPKRSLQLLKSLVSVHGFGGSGLTENLNCPMSKVNERKVTLNPARHCQRCQHCSSGASQALAGGGEL